MRAALSKVEGVADVEVNFETKKATVKMQPGKTLTSAACDAAFTGTRYKTASIEETKVP